jgi:hypothetical protein
VRDYFPAALEAYQDLDAPDTLELLAKAPSPAAAAKLTTAQVAAALTGPAAHSRGVSACEGNGQERGPAHEVTRPALRSLTR